MPSATWNAPRPVPASALHTTDIASQFADPSGRSEGRNAVINTTTTKGPAAIATSSCLGAETRRGRYPPTAAGRQISVAAAVHA
nr:hypothetical protein [Actinomadura rudentiformis]